MRKNYLVLAIVLILFVAALATALPLIEKGFASLSQSDNTEDLDSTLKVFAERTDGGNNGIIAIPHVTYQESNDREYWYPSLSSDAVSGELTIKAVKAASLAQLRVMVNFEKQGTWMLIESITLTLSEKGDNNEQNAQTYTIYDSLLSVGIAGKPTNSIGILKQGTYDFSLNVKYKPMLKNDPRPYHDGNMVSTVLFLAKEIDPLGGFLIELVKENDDGEKGYDILYEDTVSSTINNPFEKPGYSFVAWYTGPNGTGEDHTDITWQKIKDGPYSDTKLYAYWTVNTLTVNYSDGTTSQTITGYPEDPVQVKNPTGEVPQGKSFRHWIDETTEKIYHPGDDLRSENTSTHTMTLTAVYETKYAIVTSSTTTASVDVSASESGQSATSVFVGEVVILTFTPETPGNSLKTLTITGVSEEDITQLADNRYSFVSVSQEMDITAVYDKKYAVHARDITGATLSMTGSFFAGDTVELNFNKMGDAEYRYVKVNGSPDGVTELTDTKFTFTAGAYDAYIDAEYAVRYDVNVNASSGGTVTVDKSTVFAGETVTITVTPDQGYSLADIACTSTAGVIDIENNTFEMPEGDVVINATFAPLRTVAQGTVTGATLSISPSSVLAGETVTLTFTPNVGYYFVSLSVKFNDGQEKTIEYSGSNNVYTFTAVDYNMIVDAVYALKYSVNVNTPTGGTVIVDKSTAFAGETVTITATPELGYRLISVSCTSTGGAIEIENNTFVMPAGAVTIDATFAPLHTVTQGTVTGATLEIDPSSVLAGETVTLTFAPTAEYHFVSLSVKFNDGQEKTIEYSGSNNVYTFTAVDYNMVVDAVYEQPEP